MRRSFVEEDEKYQDWPNLTITDLNTPDIWAVLNAITDLEETQKFYSKLLGTFFKDSALDNRSEVINVIMKKINFKFF